MTIHYYPTDDELERVQRVTVTGSALRAHLIKVGVLVPADEARDTRGERLAATMPVLRLNVEGED